MDEVKKFVEAMNHSDEKAALEAAANIIGAFLNDVRRIADAVEALAKKPQ